MEIGSFYNMYFNKNPFNIKIHSNKNDLFFVSGRIAINFIIKNLSFNKCLIPNYLCESIFNCFDNFNYYKIDNNLNIDIDYLNNLIGQNNLKYDLILIINYFGYIDKNISKIKNICKNNNIIILEDFTHNLFSDNLYGDICISSFRKTLPTPFGSIVKINSSKIKFNQKKSISINYLYLNFIKIIGSLLKNISYLKMVWRPILIYCEKNIDNLKYDGFDFINYYFYNYYYNLDFKKKRENNILYLKRNLNFRTKKLENIYFCYILQFLNKKDRDTLKSHLIKNKIYCTTYWPLDFDINNKCNNNIYDKMLNIPIDQRYNINNMKYIIKCIKSIN